jgi:hypothetical protein
MPEGEEGRGRRWPLGAWPAPERGAGSWICGRK